MSDAEEDQHWTAHFHRWHAPEVQECDSPAEAFSALMWGEESFSLSADRITNPDGSTLIEGDELDRLISSGSPEAFDAWLKEHPHDPLHRRSTIAK
jgi:hypothetical protein